MRGNGGFGLSYVDEFVDGLLTKERVCATSLWKLVPRGQLEDEDKLEERVSPVAYLLESENEGDEWGEWGFAVEVRIGIWCGFGVAVGIKIFR